METNIRRCRAIAETPILKGDDAVNFIMLAYANENPTPEQRKKNKKERISFFKRVDFIKKHCKFDESIKI